MKHPAIRITLFILQASLVVLTILWGLALFTGQPQPSWNTLTISHFTGITILLLPLILGGEVILVGSSALLGSVTIFIQHESALHRSMAVGLIIAVYQIVEALVFLQYSWLEAIYLVSGLMIFGLAWYLCMTEYHGWTMKREGAHLYIGRTLQRSPLHP
jgi:hypothetical protein